MFEHDRIDISEGIDANKTDNPRRCNYLSLLVGNLS